MVDKRLCFALDKPDSLVDESSRRGDLPSISISVTLIGILTLVGASSAAAGPPRIACSSPLERTRRGSDNEPAEVGATINSQILGAKSRIMLADYHADIAALGEEAETLSGIGGDGPSGYLVHYWIGFARWRAALNGASLGMPPSQVLEHLRSADDHFDRSMTLCPTFADSHAAAAAVNGWLSTFQRHDASAMRERITRAKRHLARAKELEPTNPRVLWVDAGNLFSTPPEYGGSESRAIELYKRIVTADSPARRDSPLPDWGVPEAMMGLAFAHLHRQQPDLEAAAAEAERALRLIPEWYYVRRILLPQIVEARASRSATQDCAH